MNHLLHSEYGFEKDKIMNVTLQGNKFEDYASKIRNHVGIEDISASSSVLATGGTGYMYLKDPTDITDSLGLAYISASSNFLSNHDISLIAGESFPNGQTNTHENYILINQAASEKLGFASGGLTVGQQVLVSGVEEPIIIQGVVENFHFANMMEEIGPFAIRYQPEDFRYANIKLKNPEDTSTIAYLKSSWKKLDNDHVFEAGMMNEQVKESHMIFSDISFIVGYISILAVTIACLGLLGMIVFITKGRMKEVGIRKVFGATTKGLILMLSKGFFMMMLISVLIALPLALMANNLWLQQFAVHIELGVGILLLGIILIAIPGLLAIMTNTISTSKTNASDILRYE